MAGGVWYNQNKIRPAAYINFKTLGDEADLNGARGIATFAMDLSWGAENSLIEITPKEMTDGSSLAKLGFLVNDNAAKLINLVLENASLLKIYRLNTGGQKATATIEDLTVTAKYAGTFGNKIAILITLNNGVYTVTTYADGYEVDVQKVTGISGLEDNDFVIFSGTGNLAVTVTSQLLTGGTDATTTAATAYTSYFNLLKETNWQTLAICNNATTVNPLAVTFIQDMRNNEGRYVQAVLANYSSADYEGIINNVNGVVMEDGTSISALEFTAWVAGATAGASLVESNTGKVINGAVGIVDQLSNDAIIAGLRTGKFILSANQNGTIKVEKDINSLHTYSDDISYNFTKNRVIRVLDTIGSDIKNIWETTFLGLVSNNTDGRDLFKASLVNYLKELQDKGAIQDFNGASDVSVEQGQSIDSVVASITVKPVDSMEYLYLTINVVE